MNSEEYIEEMIAHCEVQVEELLKRLEPCLECKYFNAKDIMCSKTFRSVITGCVCKIV